MDLTKPVWEYSTRNINNEIEKIKLRFEVTKDLSNYRFENLKDVDQKLTTIELLKTHKKTNKISKGFYSYQFGDVNYCLIVYTKDNYENLEIDNQTIPDLLNFLSNDGEGLNEYEKEDFKKTQFKHEQKIKTYFENEHNCKFYLSYNDLKYYLSEINRYLFNLKYSLMPPVSDNFFELFLKTYYDRCQRQADSTCLTHIRCIIGDFMLIEDLIKDYQDYVFEKFPLFTDLSNQDKLSIYYSVLNQMYESKDISLWDDNKILSAIQEVQINNINQITIDTASTLLTFYCQKYRLGLYSQDSSVEQHLKKLYSLCNIERFQDNFSDREMAYFLANLRSAHHKGWSKTVLEFEISQNLQNLAEKAKVYQEECVKSEAFFLLRKRVAFYQRYNGIVFIKLINNNFPTIQLLQNGNEVKTVISRFEKYQGVLDKILPDLIQGMFDFYSLLRLFCRSGEKISDGIKSGLLDKLTKIKSQAFSCEDICLIDTLEWDFEKKPLNFEDSSVQFFVVGNRVIGINHNEPSKPLYVYDYGDTQDTLARKFQEIKNLNQSTLDELKKLKENQVTHEEYIGVLFGWYKHLLANSEISKISNEVFYFFNEEDPPVYSNIDKIQQLIVNKSKTFLDENLRIQHVESMFENYILRGLFSELNMRIKHSSSSSLQKDISIVTYPQICRRLPEMNANVLAQYMRTLLRNEVEVIEDIYRPVVVLVAAWFLAETGRNPLTFLITLMILDLIEAHVPYNTNLSSKKCYNWRNIVWNYDILNGCDLFLMSTDINTLFKLSDPWHLYLYKENNNQFFYCIASNKKEHIDEKLIQGILETENFNQPTENPVKCKNKKICNAVLDITLKRGHTRLSNELSSDDREQLYPQKEGWAGKHPMCHGGSYGRLFHKDRFPSIEASLGQVRQKEGTIFISWLANAIKQTYKDIDVEIITLQGKSKPSETWSKTATFFIYDISASKVTQSYEKSKIIDRIINPLIQSRLNNFDCQINRIQPIGSASHTQASNPYSFWQKVAVAATGAAVIGAAYYYRNEIVNAINNTFRK